MELKVTQENLSKALNIVSKIANMKTQMPILDNILLKTSGNRLLVAATNLEIASTQYIGAKITNQGEITIPAKVVTEFVNNLPSGVIDLVVTNSHLKISSGKFTSIINGVLAEEFPELPTIDEESAIRINLKTADFRQATSQTIIATTNDLARPVLTGVLWQMRDGWLYLAATDSYRLAERKLIEFNQELSAIVPAQTMQEVLRAISDDDDEVEVLFNESQVRFRVGDTEIISQLIEGRFPDYTQLIPKDNDIQIKINKAEFAKVVKIAGFFALHSASGITVTASAETQNLSLKSIASEIGENISEAEAEVVGDGKITLNSRYLSDALSVIHDDLISFEFKGKLAPCILRPVKQDNYLHIIMPLKS